MLRLAPRVLACLALAACAGNEPPPREPAPPSPDLPAPVSAPPEAVAPPARPEAPAPPAELHGGIVDANVTMGVLEADGVRLERVACKVDGAIGLLGSLALAVSFSKRRSPLDDCAHGKTQRTQVTWTAAGGAIRAVKAEAADPVIARCVEKALFGAPAPLPAHCAATLVHGKT